MVCLLTIMVVLCVKSCTLPGAIEGIKFYLLQDFGRLKENGLLSGIYAAMGQAFFTLSLGIGRNGNLWKLYRQRPQPYGRIHPDWYSGYFRGTNGRTYYFPRHALLYNVSPTQGVGLVFITLPNMFNQMMGGRFWAHCSSSL